MAYDNDKMGINPYDDYGPLVDLLYPSIEASGNVYYGQTRKLTMDEILKKNDIGFESYIETAYYSDGPDPVDSRYEPYFHWKLGPFSGKFYYYPERSPFVYYIKYKFVIADKPVHNNLMSGDYISYERDVTLEEAYDDSTGYDNAYVDTYGYDPSMSREYDGRNFYIIKEANDWYLYIAVPHTSNTSIYDRDLILTAKGGSVDIRLNMIGQDFSSNGDYEYRLHGTGWLDYHSAAQEDADAYRANENTCYDLDPSECIGQKISLQNNETVSFRSKHSITFDTNKYVRFRFDTSSQSDNISVEASGSLAFMGKRTGADYTRDAYQYGQYAFRKLFSHCTLLTIPPALAPVSEPMANMYDHTFEMCTSLKVGPLLSNNTKSKCYTYMFSGCTSLTTAPTLLSKNISAECYKGMFSGCQSLSKIYCYAENGLPTSSSHDVTNAWTYNVAPSGEFYCVPGTDWPINSNQQPSGGSYGIPYGWVRKDIVDYDSNPRQYNSECHTLITSGMNSALNGRGDLLESDTMFHMATSFTRNNEPVLNKMNQFNEDGSFNQEIWGYKSFNSPVQFRNGIYTDDACIIATTADQNSLASSIVYQCNSLAYFDSTSSKYALVSVGKRDSQTFVSLKADKIYINGQEYASGSGGTSSTPSPVTITSVSKLVYSGNNVLVATSTSNLTTYGDIVPSTSSTRSLGSSDKRYKSVHTDALQGATNSIVNAISGIGSQGNETYSQFGDIGTIGLFSINSRQVTPGSIVPGSDLKVAVIEQYLYSNLTDNIENEKRINLCTASNQSSMDGQWRLLSGGIRLFATLPSVTMSDYHQLVLAIRIS